MPINQVEQIILYINVLGKNIDLESNVLVKKSTKKYEVLFTNLTITMKCWKPKDFCVYKLGAMMLQ